MNFFTDYNTCSDEKLTIYEKSAKVGKFNFSVKPMMTTSSFDISPEGSSLLTVDLENQTNFTFGVEVEYVLPFNKDKWSIFLEPSYQYYSGQSTRSTTDVAGGEINHELDYTSIQVPVGIRHYMFLNNDSKIFLNVAVVADFASGELKYLRNDNSEVLPAEQVINSTALGLGIGYKFKDRISIEYRYQTVRDIFNLGDKSNLRTAFLALGYTLF